MAQTFKDKVVLVTGGGGGIGRASALTFAQAGGRAAVTDRDVAAGQEALRQIEALGATGLFVQADVTDS